MNGNIGVEKVSQIDPSAIVSPFRHFDRAAFLDARWLWHFSQRLDHPGQSCACGKDRDHIAVAADFEIDIDIVICKFRRDPNGLAVAGFENARPCHCKFQSMYIHVYTPSSQSFQAVPLPEHWSTADQPETKPTSTLRGGRTAPKRGSA